MSTMTSQDQAEKGANYQAGCWSGAMYDTYLFPDEPSGAHGGRSIIEMNNMPVFLTPNEYRRRCYPFNAVRGADMGIGPFNKRNKLTSL